MHNISPNNQNLKFSHQEEWVKLVAKLIRDFLYREPTLKDYTIVTRQHCYRTHTYSMFVHEKYVGYAYIKKDKIRFIPND